MALEVKNAKGDDGFFSSKCISAMAGGLSGRGDGLRNGRMEVAAMSE